MDTKFIGKAAGAVAIAGVMAWAGYLWAGTQRSAQVEADMRVLKVEIQGQLARMADEQGRMRDDIQRLTRSVDELAARGRQQR